MPTLTDQIYDGQQQLKTARAQGNRTAEAILTARVNTLIDQLPRGKDG
ncbi:hypothetical protein [Rhodococcus koreensis]